jgi:hypothetical protein
VRRVQVHGHTVEEARAGQRTAIAIHGVEKDDVARGDTLAAPGSLRGSQVLDVRFELLGDYPKQWAQNTRVRFHLGADFGEHRTDAGALEGRRRGRQRASHSCGPEKPAPPRAAIASGSARTRRAAPQAAAR